MGNHRKFVHSLTVSSLALGLGGCFGGGVELGIPAMKPPVDDSTPEGLKAGSAGLQLTPNKSRGYGSLALGWPASCEGGNHNTVECILDQIRVAVFGTEGPTFVQTLETVDGRMAELNTRSQEGPRACVSEDAKDWSPTSFDGESFPMKFSCQEQHSEYLRVYFGKGDSHSFLFEVQDAPADNMDMMTGAFLASVDNDGNEVDVWSWSISDDPEGSETQNKNSSTALNVKANRSTGVMELRTASNNLGLSESCGVHFASNGEHIKLRVWVLSEDRNACQEDPINSCLAASDLSEAEATNCEDITFAQESIRRADIGEAMAEDDPGVAIIKSLLARTGIPELTEFNQ